MHDGPWTECGHNENKTQQFYGRFFLASNKARSEPTINDSFKTCRNQYFLHYIYKYILNFRNKPWPIISFSRVLQAFVTRILLCWPSVRSPIKCVSTIRLQLSFTKLCDVRYYSRDHVRTFNFFISAHFLYQTPVGPFFFETWIYGLFSLSLSAGPLWFFSIAVLFLVRA